MASSYSRGCRRFCAAFAAFRFRPRSPRPGRRPRTMPGPGRDADGSDGRTLQRRRLALVESAPVPEAAAPSSRGRVARLDGEGQALLPLERGAGVVGRRPLAAQLVEAVARAGALVVEPVGELAPCRRRGAAGSGRGRCDRRTSAAVSRPSVGGQGAHHQEVGDRPGRDLGDGRTAGDVDDRLVGDDLADAARAGRVGIGLRDAAERRAVAGGDDRRRSGGRLAQDLEAALAADGAVDAVRPIEGLPSTTRTYCPRYFSMIARRAASAWKPAAAIRVSW